MQASGRKLLPAASQRLGKDLRILMVSNESQQGSRAGLWSEAFNSVLGPPLPAASLRLGKDHKILMVSNESTRASNRKNMFSSLSHPHHQEASKRMSWIPKSLSTVASFHIQSETTLMIPPGTSHGRSPRRIPKGKDSKQISKIVHGHSTRAICFCNRY